MSLKDDISKTSVASIIDNIPVIHDRYKVCYDMLERFILAKKIEDAFEFGDSVNGVNYIFFGIYNMIHLDIASNIPRVIQEGINAGKHAHLFDTEVYKRMNMHEFMKCAEVLLIPSHRSYDMIISVIDKANSFNRKDIVEMINTRIITSAEIEELKEVYHIAAKGTLH